MKLENKYIVFLISYIMAVLFMAIFLAQFHFLVILVVAAIFLFLVYLLYEALRKTKAANRRKLSHDVRRSNTIGILLAVGVLLFVIGTTFLIGAFKINLEDNYDFALKGILLFLAMICLGFGVQVFLTLFRQEK